jgi:predicted DNA-binding WGR domain protein
MKLIQQTSLWFSEGNSDKIYEVDLCEVASGQFVVNFRYGRRGTTLRDGSKTVLPVAEEQARKIFDQLVSSKTREGYRESGAATFTATPAPAINWVSHPDKASYLLGLLQSSLASGKLPEKAKWSLGRLIWRLGELRIREAVPSLLALIPKSDDLQQYCISWTLGRCGDEAAIPILERLHSAPASSDKVKRMALAAWLALAKAESRAAVLNRILSYLPTELRSVLFQRDAASLRQLLSDQLGKTLGYEVLEHLYLLSEDYPTAHTVVNEWMESLSLGASRSETPSSFRSVRHLFKIAEFREDPTTFGILARRFEKVPHLFHISSWGDSAYADGHYYDNVKKELAKKDSRLAYSNKTRAYLLRRLWRTLRTLGKDEQAGYVHMAVGSLLAYSDEKDYTEPKQIRYEWYDWQTRTVNARLTHYDAYAGSLLFNQILYHNSPRYEFGRTSRAWRCKTGYEPGQPAPAQREEAFPHLWDRQPEALLQLLAQSKVARVHEFAVKALRANPRFSELITAEWALQFIDQPYAITVRLGIEWLRQYYDPRQGNAELIATLILHPVLEARVLAREWIDAYPLTYAKDPLVFASVLINPHEDVWEWTRKWLAKNPLPLADAQVMIGRVIVELLSFPNEETYLPAADAAARTLLEHLSEPLRTLGLEVVQDLLRHPLSALQILGAGILLRHQIPAQDLPASVIESLISASTPEVRQAGVQLFGKLPTERLLASREVLLAFCLSVYPEMRQAVRPIIGSLSAQDAAFGKQLIVRIVSIIQSHEPFEGLHQDLFVLVEQELAAFLPEIGQETGLQLLYSRRAVNQQLGNLLLQQVIHNNQLSIRQVVRMAGHEMLAVRQRAWQFFASTLARLKTEPEEAVRILDASWEDSRQFAFDFFRKNFNDEDWTPALLVSICDSTREDVRQFGRELITRYFKEENGTDYLLKLSQHPSQDLQLFATNYLQQFAAGKPENIKVLEPYFKTVLSQVNRSGVAKARVYALLKNEALQNEEIAGLVAQLMARQSATIAIADKAAAIQLMRDIRKAYPQLGLPLALKPVAAYVKS